MKAFYWIAAACVVMYMVGGSCSGLLAGAICFGLMGWIYSR